MPSKILILNPDNRAYPPLLRDFGEVTTNHAAFKLNPRDFKLIQFTGGEDVTPELYGDTSPDNFCSMPNKKRDEQEAEIFNIAMKFNIPMVGICRGIQFLNVMCGGKLIHHLDGHASSQHTVDTSSAVYSSFITNSLHHQMCIPPVDGSILAWTFSNKSSQYIGDRDEELDWQGPEIEAIFIPWNKVFGVQWHPEFMIESSRARLYYKILLSDFLKLKMCEFRKKYVSVESIKVKAANG